MIPRGARRVKLPRCIEQETEVVFRERAIGIKVEQGASSCVVVKSFHDIKPGQSSPAQEAGVAVGDALLSISGESVEFLTYKALLMKIRSAGRPLKLRFAKWKPAEESAEDELPGSTARLRDSKADVSFSSLSESLRRREGEHDLEAGTSKVGFISLPPKVYTRKNLGNSARETLRSNEKRCAAFSFLLLAAASLLLLFRLTGSRLNQASMPSNIAFVHGEGQKVGNITSVEGDKVTIVLSGRQKKSFLKHHFHHNDDVETIEDDEHDGGA